MIRSVPTFTNLRLWKSWRIDLEYGWGWYTVRQFQQLRVWRRVATRWLIVRIIWSSDNTRIKIRVFYLCITYLYAPHLLRTLSIILRHASRRSSTLWQTRFICWLFNHFNFVNSIQTWNDVRNCVYKCGHLFGGAIIRHICINAYNVNSLNAEMNRRSPWIQFDLDVHVRRLRKERKKNCFLLIFPAFFFLPFFFFFCFFFFFLSPPPHQTLDAATFLLIHPNAYIYHLLNLNQKESHEKWIIDDWQMIPPPELLMNAGDWYSITRSILFHYIFDFCLFFFRVYCTAFINIGEVYSDTHTHTHTITVATDLSFSDGFA